MGSRVGDGVQTCYLEEIVCRKPSNFFYRKWWYKCGMTTILSSLWQWLLKEYPTCCCPTRCPRANRASGEGAPPRNLVHPITLSCPSSRTGIYFQPERTNVNEVCRIYMHDTWKRFNEIERGQGIDSLIYIRNKHNKIPIILKFSLLYIYNNVSVLRLSKNDITIRT